LLTAIAVTSSRRGSEKWGERSLLVRMSYLDLGQSPPKTLGWPISEIKSG